ncbi:putative metal-binding motif-containing protein [Flagellimonas flava]|uniref:putative metal-binding motif-containing protein n=1 Tax=Flagellimonas flava TaxID=570519 RepID=UPI003D647207
MKSVSFYLLILSLCLFSPISCGKDKTEDPSCTQKKWFKNSDGDDQGDKNNSIMACEQPDGYVDNDDDPDDSDPNITSDCDMVTYYPDEDGDGYGKDGEDVITQCSGVDAPTNYVADNTDCDDSNTDINPDEELTAYKDADGDGYGDPEDSSTFPSCEVPEDYSLDNTDCNDTDANNYPGAQLRIYEDSDGDGFGNNDVSYLIAGCSNLPFDFVANNLDCNDDDGDIHPGAEETPGDEIDSNCDGIDGTIWNGPDVTFSKAPFADWTDPANQDKLTDNVILTRQDFGIPYNYQWWQDTFGVDAQRNGEASKSDLNALYFGNLEDAVNQQLIQEQLQGGTQGIRWAVSHGIFMGIPGKPFTYYSFHNLITMLHEYKNEYNGENILGIINNFQIMIEEYGHPEDPPQQFPVSGGDITDLIGQTVMGYIPGEEIYFTLTFTGLSTEEGGAMSYTRSSPFTLD